ncbi:MAG TPA: gamma-glutamyltransferase [Gemmatimonadaceae bacterium]|nr:gamma-glutamyltransferase [Gemmatimonadaceae bacterium]
MTRLHPSRARFAAIAVALATIAVARPAAAQRGLPAMPAHGQPLPIAERSMVITKYGIVAASQPLAARAGVHMLELGGNAVDAAIAANAANGLMEPAMNGVGGDLFAIVYIAKTGKLYGLNSSGWSATGMTPALLESKGIERIPLRGIWGVTVPGAVAGWQALHDRFGTLPLSTLLAPAIAYAKEGFPVTQVIAETWAGYKRALDATREAAATYEIDGHTPREGEIFRNPDLAQTLTRIAEHGRSGFYTGPTAQAILATERRYGGTMTAADLADFQPQWVTPLHVEYRGWTVYELPPNSQGIGALMMLQMMSHFPMADYGFHSTMGLHVMMEAKQLAYADVLRYVGDPRLANVPVDRMLDPAHAAARAALIDPAKATCSEPPSEFSSITDKKGGDTIYLTAIDKDGNIVSLIQSNYEEFGSGLVPGGAGFVLQDRGSLFTLQPDMANTLAPHKRPLHTLMPGFMEKDSVRIGFGIMGGWNQAQAHAQFVADVADYGMNIQQALSAGRFTKPGFSGCSFDIESRVPEAVRDSLSAMGYDLTLYGPRTGHFGWGQALMGTAGGVHYGASDPRHDGEAVPQEIPIGAGKGSRLGGR